MSLHIKAMNKKAKLQVEFSFNMFTVHKYAMEFINISDVTAVVSNPTTDLKTPPMLKWWV